VNSIPYYVLAGLCVVGGVVTHIFAPEGPIALSLVIAGTGALGMAAKTHANDATEARILAMQNEQLAKKEQRRADELFEQTQTLKRQG
jgi:Zn-dependent alcohol dehydrogenase